MADLPGPPGDQKPTWYQRLSGALEGFISHALRWVTLVGLAVAVAVMANRFWPNDLPHRADLSIWERIFYTRTMIFSSRVVLLVAAVYLIGSVIALIAHNKWLSEVGPFKASRNPIGALDQTATR